MVPRDRDSQAISKDRKDSRDAGVSLAPLPRLTHHDPVGTLLAEEHKTMKIVEELSQYPFDSDGTIRVPEKRPVAAIFGIKTVCLGEHIESKQIFGPSGTRGLASCDTAIDSGSLSRRNLYRAWI